GLDRTRELFAERLRVEVRERLGAHVVAAEAIALHVGPLDAHLPEAVELAELSDAGERDAVVDLAELLQAQRILRHHQDAAVVLHRDDRLAASDALPSELGLVLGHLLRVDVERERHGYGSTGRRRRASTSWWGRGDIPAGGGARARPGGRGRSRRRRRTRCRGPCRS